MNTFNSAITTYCADHWQVIESITELNSAQRAAIFGSNTCPFTSFEFLSALETHRCVGPMTGWTPQYWLYQPNGPSAIEGNDTSTDIKDIGLLIGFIKDHSYGEYVFDWSWAEAYQRHGLQYYPKFISAIPFTPVPTTKWLGHNKLSEKQAWDQLLLLLNDSACSQNIEVTGAHFLFANHVFANNEEGESEGDSIIERQGCQFHWYNRPLKDTASNTTRYATFESFLADMTARKRKMIKKERAKVLQAGIECHWRSGQEITKVERETFYQYYHNTYYKRGQQGYLTLGFFNEIFDTLSTNIRLLVCYHQGTMVAGALYFIDEKSSPSTLYGRYWGSNEGFDLVHFEACYYQGVEYAIKHNIDVFNPGTQGEHKIPRGFTPTTTYSYHSLFLDPFHEAIDDFCIREKEYNQLYMKECTLKLPFRQLLED